MQDDKGGVENVDTFLANFIKHYQKNETFRSSLVICMMKGYVAKCEGSSNHPYGAKVLNFMLALAASGSQKRFEYVSANLCSVSLQHIEHLTRERRLAPFIGIGGNEIVNRLRMHFAQICEKWKQAGSPFHRVAFTAGFDGTVLMKSFQVLHLSNVVVGGVYPNHFIPIPPGSSAVEMGKLLKDCGNGNKYGEPAAEIKVCVKSFQDTPPGMCPYFTLVGQP
jgi:hypothetical protein